MKKIIDFLKKINIIKIGSTSYTGKNITMSDPDFIPNKKESSSKKQESKNNKSSQSSW